MELTESEQEIIKYMKSGLTFRQIAEQTGTSVTNVSRQVNALYERFNAKHRLEFLNKIKSVN